MLAQQRCAMGRQVPGRAPPALPPRPARRLQSAARCSQPGSSDAPPHQHERDNLPTLVVKAALLAATANALVACLPPAAQAAAWRPRRHESGLRQEYVSRETPKQAAARKAAQKKAAAAAAAAEAARQAEQEAALNDVQRALLAAQRKLKAAFGGERAVFTVRSTGSRADAYARPGAYPEVGAVGWLPLVLAAGAAAALAFRGRIQWPWGKGRREGGGRWVRDRSLGGKMVWVADPELPEPGQKAPRPLWEDLDDGGAAASAAAAAGSEAGTGPWAPVAGAAPGAAPPAADALPAWWDEPAFTVFTTFTRKEELQRQARVVLRELEDAKLLRGLDYPLSGLVTLRTLCQEAGGYQVKPRTESGRDSMLRAAVKAAIAAGQEGAFSLLGGDPPARFVCGLAHDLGVPPKRAVTIVHAEVASLCRSALIDAEAAFRAGDQGGLLVALLRLAGALETFPLPRGSAEAELVAAGVVRQTGLEFRKAIFLEFGAVSKPLAALVAEMLGFNPELVMPELERQLADALAAAAQGAVPQAPPAEVDERA